MVDGLRCERILLLSAARNYEVELRPGVNVIAGPIYTGKSSIPELIDYACGAASPIKYPEIRKCTDSLVEFSIGKENFTIQRSLRNQTTNAMLHFGSIQDVLSGTAESKEISPKQLKGKESISSEILFRLGLAEIEIKTAPKQDASDTNVFSIRDLVRLLYVKQGRMGNAPGFFEDDYKRFLKWQAAFQVVHGLYDSKAALLAKALKEAKAEKGELESSLATVQRFLTESNVPFVEELVARLQEIAKEREQIESESARKRDEEIETLGIQSQLLDQRNALADSIQMLDAQVSELDRTLSQLGRLQVQYERELSQLEFLRESNALLSTLPITRCPACFQHIEHELSKETCYACHRSLPVKQEELVIDTQLRSLQFRITDLDKYTAELSERKRISLESRSRNVKALASLDRSIESIRRRTVFPRDRQLLESAALLSKLDQEEEQLRRYLSWRHKARGDGSNLTAINERINSLEDEIGKSKGRKVNSNDLIESLSQLYRAYLERFRFPSTIDETAFIDGESYLPFVRGQVYSEVRSNGGIALIQCAWQLAVLRYSIASDTLYPKFLILDSPLNHVGKADSDPAFRDQQIVDQFYDLVRELHRNHADAMQLIICDNYPPKSVQTELVQVQFTGIAGVGRYGLIDDEIPAQQGT